MSVKERDVAGIGIVNLTDQVDVSISIVDSDAIAANLSPSPATVPGETYVVSVRVDGVLSQLRGTSWTVAEIAANETKDVVFGGLDLNGVGKIVVSVGIDQSVVVVTGDDVAMTVSQLLPMAITADRVVNGLSGYIIDATIEDPTVARFVDVTFPSSLGLAVFAPDPVSGPTVRLSASDLLQVINPGDVDVLLASLDVEALAAGSSGVLLDISRFDDDSGDRIRSIVRTGVITVS